eukprot:505095_1
MATNRTRKYAIGIVSIVVCGTAAYYLQRYVNNKKSDEKLNKVQELFEKGQPLKSAETVKGIHGRIKFFIPKDTIDKNGKAHWMSQYHMPCSWVVGSCGLYELSQCKSDYDKLLKLGWTDSWIKQQLQKYQKCHFNLYLFPEKSSNYTVIWATWDGIFQFLKQNEYEIFKRTQKFKQILKQMTWDEIQQKGEFQFEEIDNKWHLDPRFMTKEKFLSIPQTKLTIVHVRLLFYCYMCLSRLFSGHGYTVDKNGKLGCKEYIIKNMRLEDIANLKMVELKIE